MGFWWGHLKEGDHLERLGRPRHRWENNIKKEVGWGCTGE